MGAQGIGLCRTEHMFLGERKQYVERLILAESDTEKEEALAALLPFQRQDRRRSSRPWTGCRPPSGSWTRRCTNSSLTARRWPSPWLVAEERGDDHADHLRLLEAVEKLHESNPMLGLRGVRLGLSIPGLFGLQVRAIAEATATRIKAGGDPQAEIMIPLVGAVQELELNQGRVAGGHRCCVRGDRG